MPTAAPFGGRRTPGGAERPGLLTVRSGQLGFLGLLQGPHLGIDLAAGQQFLMPATLDDAALLHHQDLILSLIHI